MPTKSSTLFSIGVPVRAQLRPRGIDRTTSLVVLAGVFDPLCFIQHDEVVVIVRMANMFAIANQNFVIGDRDQICPAATAIAAAPGRLRSR